ncbi:dTDP-4-amino-4,6-dideoxygalactose transaminase [Pseudomaricurvus alkylphenolicus]|uniref:dTDP-4-amino-4,6-dideoxygalactose transaminase n=1 Tax=Pseudomaricurvus alkylphenolicus TaxID=1306991 RepID=UPI0014206979|nr:dTDP-4-amino-4,6-dideoxygalactose transaminase [Pseudomaricurvus alkylphenolicus]NIB40027.1 dTDP-4-amino-4,6-dideoxygalactose transaminase [Pseudomaricurvus alkylphenolicus]
MIPFHKPYHAPSSQDYLNQVIESGHHGGDGPFGRRCEQYLQDLIGCHRALLTTSCSVALDMCAMLIDAKPGDEVLVPSFTFVTTANAFYNRGAKPVFVDCLPGTLNMDPDHAEALVNSNTVAIVPMHYGGVACDMNAIMKLANKEGLLVIEDAAQAIDGYYDGQPLGSLGHLSTLSFHETKNITCGEGGALLINDQQFKERAEIIREKGTNRRRFFEGLVDKYSWLDIGSSYVQSDLLSSYLLGQLEAHKIIKQKRRDIWNEYYQRLKPLENAGHLCLPQIGKDCDPSWHLFFVLTEDNHTRKRLLTFLKDRGVMAQFHYLPLHLSDVGVRLGSKPGDCPNSERFSETLVRLPFYTDMPHEEVELVCRHLGAFYGH